MHLKQGAHVHFLGICGTAMASLAGMLQAMGYRVTGSDENVYPPMSTMLHDLGIEIKQGYRKENLEPKPDLAIVGNIMSPKAEESIALMQSDIPRISMPQAIREFVIEDRISIVAAGTHGKTTTTAMLAHVAEKCGQDPGFLVGGIPKNFGISFRPPKANTFVIEGDEYETCFLDKGSKFMHYKPDYAVLHLIEMDHIEYFKTFDRLKAAFRGFVELIPKQGILVSAHTETNLEVIKNTACERVFTFGWEQGDYQVRNFRSKGIDCWFDVLFQGTKQTEIKLQQFGDYNALNALATYAIATQAGWPIGQVLDGLATFAGVKRRQEVIGKPNDILVIEDFAHHPTAVKQTINSIQKRFPENKVISIFEPRSATSCRSIFQNEYLDAMKLAQTLILAPPNAFRNLGDDKPLDVDLLVKEVAASGVEAFKISDVTEIVKKVKTLARPGDVVLVMSNGAFGGIYSKLLEALK